MRRRTVPTYRSPADANHQSPRADEAESMRRRTVFDSDQVAAGFDAETLRPRAPTSDTEPVRRTVPRMTSAPVHFVQSIT